jgi:cation diffusion facilitator CzcD-associated flavoprotein CzcO
MIDIANSSVAVIGAGPAGLVAARWLIAEGLEPVILEAADRLGGQWNAANPASATWPGMRTNTSRVMTAFSDLDHPEGTAVYPTREAMHAYLERYAAAFGLTARLRLGARVERVERGGGGWHVTSVADGARRTETFAAVVGAPGRHAAPRLAEIPGLAGFSGALGALHTARYDGPARYRGRSVVVGGCSISALEIGSELALNGAAVTVSCRRPRYVLPKLIAGVPTDHVMFTRAAALAGEALPAPAVAAGLRAAVLKAAGSPGQVGAPEPDADVLVAGVTQSQHFLPLVAEGRIAVRPWIAGVDGRTVRFADGSTTEADAILLGTGYRATLPWLSEAASGVPDLAGLTFAPGLPGLALLGLYDLVGPYFPVLELQARWAARVLAGRAIVPAEASPPPSVGLPMHALAVMFARLAGVEPDPARWPALGRALMFGPLSPASFRLTGPHALPDAAIRTAASAAAFGAIVAPEFTPEEAGLAAALAGTRRAA